MQNDGISAQSPQRALEFGSDPRRGGLGTSNSPRVSATPAWLSWMTPPASPYTASSPTTSNRAPPGSARLRQAPPGFHLAPPGFHLAPQWSSTGSRRISRHCAAATPTSEPSMPRKAARRTSGRCPVQTLAAGNAPGLGRARAPPGLPQRVRVPVKPSNLPPPTDCCSRGRCGTRSTTTPSATTTPSPNPAPRRSCPRKKLPQEEAAPGRSCPYHRAATGTRPASATCVDLGRRDVVAPANRSGNCSANAGNNWHGEGNCTIYSGH